MKALLAVVMLAVAAQSAPAPYGILLMAHGGEPSWNAEIASLRAKVDAKVPTEAALGMADPASLQAAVDRLEKRGVARIVAVPLFIQSRSEVLDQASYALGLSDKPSEVLRAAYARIGAEHAAHAARAGAGGMAGHHHGFSTERVKARVPIALARALDDDALVGRILLERAKALSRDAAKERVVLVAHGPVDDAAVPAWEDSLRALCADVKKGGFPACSFGVLRDDAAPEIRAASVADLREKVAGVLAEKRRVIVVPVLIARGGIETKIPKDFAGLDYAWDGKTLMPHAGFDAWVLARAAAAGRR